MNKMNIMRSAFGLMVAALAFGACSDSDHYDVVGNPDNLVYFKVNATNTVTCTVVHTPVGELGRVAAAFPVCILRPAAAEARITATIDNSLIAGYNTRHGTGYEAVPDGLVDGVNLKATIQKDSVKSADTIKVAIASTAFEKLTAKSYLVPVKIAAVEGDGVGSQERGVAYLVVNTETRLIQTGVEPDDMPGTLADDHEGWTAAYDTGTAIDAASLFNESLEDGPGLRADEDNGRTQTVIVDMQTNHDVTGFRMARYYKSWYGGWWYDEYYFSEVKMQFSTDGNTWSEIGTAYESEMPKQGGYQYVALYGAVKARYLKFEIKSGESSVSSLAELGVYVK